MNAITPFIVGLGITVAASGLVVAYLHAHLRKILIDLCGTVERANFWMAFSNVTLMLVPLILALHYRPAGAPQSVFFHITDQLGSALIGLITTMGMVGLVLRRFISQKDRAAGLTPVSARGPAQGPSAA
jgi:uncharacterized membrane protein YhaH (DUF805 family)